MNKVILAAVALLAVSGSAFAGSDNYGSQAANPPAVDASYTASVRKSEPATQKPVTTGADHNLFGNN
ncbi:DUF680 domain-containing protein [Mesorhizobium sp. MSK_1335]|uniref:DUF680 domain-containing protein n=1 Tax=Mesorhizobium montanum TaxID=3072323 RepID=A0ABU4ZP83_9HYPH|nr:DUF680 domain-containing protein [Mesorhizobium sp. MSK_1335]MDX8527190.1 DUF680 domain-containing protein [Mesorhizobium sp. MSK_1335]